MPNLKEEVSENIEELEETSQELIGRVTEVTDNITVSGSTWGYDGNIQERFDLLREYEQWYNRSYPLINEYLPDRAGEYRSRYETVRRGLENDLEFINERDINNPPTLQMTIVNGFQFQRDLLSSVPSRVKSEQLKANERVTNDILASELQKAKELFDQENIRAAGVVTGVALERHLLTLCETSDQNLEFDYMDGITSLSHTLKQSGEIQEDDRKLLEYLASIRNKCSHASNEEPENREVERLIKQSDEFINTA